jgi:hypothetical protein
MTATPSIDLPAWMAEQLSKASADLSRRGKGGPRGIGRGWFRLWLP